MTFENVVGTGQNVDDIIFFSHNVFNHKEKLTF